MTHPSPRSRSKLKSWLINLGLLTLSSVAALLLGEFLLRSFVRVGSFQWQSESGHHWNSEDPARDYVLTPGFRGRLRAPEFDHPVHINSLGFRGTQPDLADRPGFVIGDSFVFGVGADEQETLPSRLAFHLERKGRPQAVWNLGIPSHSSPQYRLTYEQLRKHARPTWLVVCLFMGRLPSDANDLWGAVTFETQRADRADQEAAVAAEPESGSATAPNRSTGPTKRLRNSLKWLQRHSAFYTLMASRVAPGLRAWRHRGRELVDQEIETFEQGWLYLGRDLRAMSAATADHGTPLLLVHIPEASDVINENWQIFERLSILATELDLPLVDLRSAFAADQGREYYYPLDGHLNPAGYDRVAEEISLALLDIVSAPNIVSAPSPVPPPNSVPPNSAKSKN